MLIVTAAVAARDGRIMLCQRREGVHNALKWEFPGGKLEPGETPEACLARELREELNVEAEAGRIMDALMYRYPDRDVLLLFYRCAIKSGEPVPVDCRDIAWVAPGALEGRDLARADRAFVQRNAEALRAFAAESVRPATITGLP